MAVTLPLTRPQPARLTVRGSQVAITNASLEELLRIAANRPSFVVSSDKARVVGDRFDLLAKLPEGFRGNLADVRRLLWPLVANTFAIVSHVEKRAMPVYELTVSDRGGTLGPKLAANGNTCAEIRDRLGLAAPLPGGEDPDRPCLTRLTQAGRLLANMNYTRISMEQLAKALVLNVERPVVDKTGLKGFFDAELQYYVGPATETNPSPDSDMTIYRALQEQLGLKLTATTGQVDVLVIDAASAPKAN